ncbi:MAG: ABC transporter ATP-binding protein [Deltaproteobacteria bacterium]
MLKVQNISKKYGDLVALDDVSFQVNRGEVLGFLGPNGAGKTTTMRIITGYMPPTDGTVTIADLDILENPIEAKSKIGYLPENPPLYFDMTIRDYLGFVADIRGVPKSKKKDRIIYAMDICAIAEVRGRLIGNMSKGYRQRIGIAQALIHDPEILVLDEPTVGLDPKQIIEIRELIKSLAGERTVVLSTHVLPEVTMTCSRVVIINEGRIVLEETIHGISDKVRGGEDLFLKIGSPSERIAERIISIAGVLDVSESAPGEFLVRPKEGQDVRDELSRLAVQSNWGLLEMRPLTHTLEQVFLRVISTEGKRV